MNGTGDKPTDDDDEELGLAYAPPSDRQLKVNGKWFSYYKTAARERPRPSVLFCLPVMDPLGKSAFWWGIMTTCVDMTYTAFLVPLSAAFSDVGERDFLNLFDLIGNVVYLLDLLMGFCIGFVVFWGSRWLPITDGRLVAWHYIRHGAFVINVLAMLPLVLQALMLGLKGEQRTQAIQLVYLMRLLRMTRVVSAIRSLSSPLKGSSLGRVIQGWVSATRLMVFNAVFTLLVLLNLLGCLWWTVARIEGLEESWAAHISKSKDLLDAGDTTRYLVSVYYVMTTMTTIGYGDITPWTNLEIGISLIYMLIGVAFFSYLINVVAELLQASHPRRAAAAVQEKLRALDEWTAGQQLPQKLRRRVRKYFLQKWMQDAGADEGVYYAQMPACLRQLVQPQLQSQVLSECELLPDLSKESRGRLQALVTANAVPVAVYPGQVLYRKGEEVKYFYILDEGTMTVSSGAGWCKPATFSGPAVLGLSGLVASEVSEYAHHFQTATAVTGCHLWRVDCAELAQRLNERHAGVLLEVALSIKERVTAALQRAQQFKWDVPGTSLSRQRRVVARLGAAAQGLARLCEDLAAAAEEQERHRREEAAAATLSEAQGTPTTLLQQYGGAHTASSIGSLQQGLEGWGSVHSGLAAPTMSTISSLGPEGCCSGHSAHLELASVAAGRGAASGGNGGGGSRHRPVVSASQRQAAKLIEILEVIKLGKPGSAISSPPKGVSSEGGAGESV